MMSDGSRRDATPPPPHRSVTPSLVDVLESSLERVVGEKLDSLRPEMEQQTAYMRESAEERTKRVAAERAGRWWRRLRLLAMVIIAVCEAYQTFRGH